MVSTQGEETVMKVILATHLASEGNVELYEEFLQKRKISFIRDLPESRATEYIAQRLQWSPRVHR